MPDYGLFQSQELKQEQVLAPHQIQSLEILMVPLLQLQEKITEELENNPVLEQERSPALELTGDSPSSSPASQQTGGDESRNSGEKDVDEELLQLMRLADSWQDYLPPLHSRQSFSAEDEDKRQHMFDSLVEEPSLQEQLLEQLRLAECESETRAVAEVIIGSIDDSGYLRSHLADIAIVADVSLEKVEAALKLVHSFDPPGIGARDLKESLLLQLMRQGKGRGKLAQLVRNHLDDIAKNRLPQIAKSMKIKLDELYAMLNTIRSLAPYPGSAFAPDNPVFVIPEVTVELVNGEYCVVSNEEQLPRLKISSLYRKLLEDPSTPEETRAYIKAKLANGKVLIKSLEQRQSTIRRIAEVIVDTQYDFFEIGLEHLRPLTMQQVADKLNLHETTISRAIANKYMQTPNGLFDFKYFFSGGYQADDGGEVSAKSVKEKIRDLVMKEDSAKPLSDKKIGDLLKEQGIPVARRTVAKYREELGIASSHLRKEF